MEKVQYSVLERGKADEKRSLTIHTSQEENSKGIREASSDHSIDTLTHSKCSPTFYMKNKIR